MSINHISLGAVPAEENCAQVGQPDYASLARREARAYINQLKRSFPNWEKDELRFATHWFPHDFGNYAEVCVFFDDANEAALSAAYRVERQLPGRWDEAALAELKKEQANA